MREKHHKVKPFRSISIFLIALACIAIVAYQRVFFESKFSAITATINSQQQQQQQQSTSNAMSGQEWAVNDNPAATITYKYPPDEALRWPDAPQPIPEKGASYVDAMKKGGVPNSILFQLINNTVYVFPPENLKDGFNTNLVHTFMANMQRMCMVDKTPLPNFEVPFIGVADPGLVGSGPLSKFSGFYAYCTRQELVGLRPMPRPYFDSKKLARADKTPWEKKIDKAIFRGSLSSQVRLNLYKLWKRDPDLQQLLDVGITKIPEGAPIFPDTTGASAPKWCAGCPEKWAKEEHIEIAPRMEMDVQQQFKYVVSVDGAGCADRLGHLLTGHFVVLRQASQLEEHYYGLLMPYVHYVPIKHDYSDLAEKIQWLQKHDKYAQQIVKDANNFAETMLTREGLFPAWKAFIAAAAQLSSPAEPSALAVKYRQINCTA